ncbi:MAG: hypothetical protein ACREAA_07130 [Candidatus Polarisedimenticolia bacterium]
MSLHQYRQAMRVANIPKEEAAEVALRAKRRGGEMLASLEKNKGRASPGPRGSDSEPRESEAAKLSEVGVTKKESHLSLTRRR